MFKLCNVLEYLDLSNFDIHNVKIMSSMFNGCEKLKQINGINHFDTSNVISIK